MDQLGAELTVSQFKKSPSGVIARTPSRLELQRGGARPRPNGASGTRPLTLSWIDSLANAVKPAIILSCMVSTAVLGTITIDAFVFRPSCRLHKFLMKITSPYKLTRGFSFLHKKSEPIGACSTYIITGGNLLPRHFVPASFFNKISPIRGSQ